MPGVLPTHAGERRPSRRCGSVPVAVGLTSRRAFVLGGVAALAARSAVPRAVTAASPPSPSFVRTWLLNDAAALRPAPPSTFLTDEIAAVRRRQAAATGDDLAFALPWHDPAVAPPWFALALDLVRSHRLNPVRAGRGLALLATAIADAVVAVADARTTFPAPAPSAVDGSVRLFGPGAAPDDAFPSEQAAVAAAAAEVLAALFPAETGVAVHALAGRVGESRVVVGRAFPRAVEAGWAIGQAVGRLAVARGLADGADVPGALVASPDGDGVWRPTPPSFAPDPLEPRAGTWRPWLLPRGDALRPSPPPAYRTRAWWSQLEAVRTATRNRTAAQEAAVARWDGGPGTATPAGLWLEIALGLIAGGGSDAAAASRVLALTAVAIADGFVCCWDAKYAYWTLRPVTADPSLPVLIPTPPFPSYTSGHATVSTAASTVLGHLFPDRAADLNALAAEAAASRIWAGIHFPVDVAAGAVGGGEIGRLAVARGRGEDA